MYFRRSPRFAVLLSLLPLACGDASSTPVDGAVATDALTATDAPARPADAPMGADVTADGGALCAPSAVTCVDQQVMGLRLFDTPNPAEPVEEGTAPGEFTTLIDARAGGSMVSLGFVYARFTPAGLQRVAISDEQAFTSSEWDLAFRRFVIRVNSGVSGPSCVSAARTAPGTTFESLRTPPEGLQFRTEAYYTPSCELVNDGSGIGSPGTATASFWSYRSCVQMTGNVYVIRLRDGRHVKLQVRSYYDPAAQATCDATGAVPQPNGAGNLRVRWAFLGA